MFSPNPGSISMFAAGCKRAMKVIRGILPGANKMARYESASTLEATMIGMICAAVACDEFGQQQFGPLHAASTTSRGVRMRRYGCKHAIRR
jgi:hypothetical protein